MILGLDFDNTLVCYEHAFALEASRLGMPGPASKLKLREFLRAEGREDEWTELQGHVYGPGLSQARPFAGALDFLKRFPHKVVVVSHKTLRPFRGPAHDLHAYARQWLRDQGLGDVQAYFEVTKEEKLARIGELGCTHFLDDLPEILGHRLFPAGVKRLLFDPQGEHESTEANSIVRHFDELDRHL